MKIHIQQANSCVDVKTSIPGYWPIPVYINYMCIYIYIPYITLHCIALHYHTLHYHTLLYHTLHYHTCMHASIHTYIEREIYIYRPTYIIRYTYIYITCFQWAKNSKPNVRYWMGYKYTHIRAHTHTRIHTDSCSKGRTKLLALYICCGQALRFARGTLKTLQIVGDSGIPEKLR